MKMRTLIINEIKKRQLKGVTKRSILLAVCFIAFTCACFAQDIIVTKDSKRIDAKVMEVNTDNVKYKRTDYLDGPLYTIRKSDIVTIVYQNGRVDTFTAESSTPSTSTQTPVSEPVTTSTPVPTTAQTATPPPPASASEKKSNGVFEIISFSNDSVKLRAVAETKFHSAALIAGNQTFEAKMFTNSNGTVRWVNGAQFWPGSSMQLPAAMGVGAMTLPQDAVLTVYGFTTPANFKATKIRVITEGKNEMFYNISTSSWDQDGSAASASAPTPVQAPRKTETSGSNEVLAPPLPSSTATSSTAPAPSSLSHKPDLILAAGEILYRGKTKFENSDSVIVSFVLSADRKTAKDYYLELYGIRVNWSKIETKQSGSATAEVKNGGMAYSNDKWQITIKQGLGADTVPGEFNCVYEHREYTRDYRENITRVDLGKAPIEFKKVIIN